MMQIGFGRYGRFLAVLAAATMSCALAPPAAHAEVTTLMQRDSAASETTSPDTALALARQRLDAHNASAAVDGLQRYLAVYPQELTVKRFLADLYFRIGALTDAEATYRDILQGYPYDTQAHRRLGTLDFLAGRTDAAIVEFEASLPESIDDLVVAHERKGDVDAFEREMQHRAQTSPRDASVQYEMGAVYGDLHLPHDALAYFRRALAIYPSSTDILNGTAIAQMQVHDDAGAEQTFDRCLHYDGESYACTNDLGSLYLDEKRYPDARRVLLRAHGLAPEAPEALVNLGYLSDELGNRAEAVGYYTEAIYVWPYFSDGYVNLSYDQIRQGSFDQAESVLHKGLAVAPADPRMHYLLGIVDEVRGNRPEAVAEFQRAETSNDPDIVNSARQSVDDLQKSMPASESAPPASRPPSPLR